MYSELDRFQSAREDLINLKIFNIPLPNETIELILKLLFDEHDYMSISELEDEINELRSENAALRLQLEQ